MTPTTIFTFWLCLTGTTCDSDHALKNSKSVIELPGVTILHCDEMDALTNLRYFEYLLAAGRLPRHSCIAKEEAL